MMLEVGKYVVYMGESILVKDIIGDECVLEWNGSVLQGVVKKVKISDWEERESNFSIMNWYWSEVELMKKKYDWDGVWCGLCGENKRHGDDEWCVICIKEDVVSA